MAVFSKFLRKAKLAKSVDVGVYAITQTIPVGASDVVLNDDVQFVEMPHDARLLKVDVTDDNATLVVSAQLNRGGVRTVLTAPASLLAGDIIEANIDTDGAGNVTLDALLARN